VEIQHKTKLSFEKALTDTITSLKPAFRSILAFLCISFLFSSTYAAGPIPAVDKIELKIMTYNIRHGKGIDNIVDLKRIEREIRWSGVEIVALQEVDRYVPRSRFTDQVRELARELGMYYAFEPTLGIAFVQYGNAILSKYPIVRTSVVFLPGWSEPRAMMTSTVSVRGSEVDVVNLHLSHLSRDRIEQVPIVLAELGQRENPTLVMGDFNMLGEGADLAGLRELLYEIPLDQPASTVMGGGQIDHIFANFPVVADKVYTVLSDASDHLPVIAEMGWHPELLTSVGKK
jgi:endonuclease/exonuclease/phosphatase family metal-dependent hydrolase